MLLCRTVQTGFGLDFNRLLEETPPEVFEQWRALYDLEPWAEERADFAVGTAIMHTVAAHGVQPKEPIDYMHYLKLQKQRTEKPQGEDQMQVVWDAICRQMERKQAEPLTPDP